MSSDDPIQARIGTTLKGKWTLERLLGEGAMAAVYLAVHSIGRREAIKVLHKEIAHHPEVRARFEQEAYAVNRLQHPGAVAIHDIDETEDGAPFMVMEFLEGESLAARLEREERIPQAELLRIVDELLDVLAAAHGIGIVHRDVKPDNLFLLPSGKLKVLDFGIARLRDGSPTHVKTRIGAMLGTPNYMAPEQCRAVDIDHRVDLFAVGAVMFELTAGHDVHDASSPQELLAKMLTTPAPPLARAAPQAHPDLCKIVDRALAFDRDQRYPDARSMQRDVRALREGKPLPQAAAPATRVDAPPARSAALVAAAATVVSERMPPVASAPVASVASVASVAPVAPVASAPVPPAAVSEPTPPPAVMSSPKLPPPNVAPELSAKARRERLAIIAAALALIVIVVLLWLSSSSEGDSAPAASPSVEADRFREQEERRWEEEQERKQEQKGGKRGHKKWK
jgi:serine/threonine-protein kinase